VLIVAPWSGFWEQNFFARVPLVAAWLSSNFVRGGVSGVGVITAMAGLAELGGAFGLGRRQPDAADRPAAAE
jgi:hypothetical protein